MASAARSEQTSGQGHPMRGDQKNPIHAILFDFGGVIAEEGFHEGLKAIARSQGLDPQLLERLGMDTVYDSGYVTGKGNEEDFWRLLRERSGIAGSNGALRHEILSRFTVRSWMLELVRELRRRGYQTALLSDQTEWLDELDTQQDFLQAFDRVFVSYRLGKGKRDASLFDEVIESLGLTPEQAIFIDDAPANIETANNRGLRGLLYTDHATLEAKLWPLLE